MDVPGSDEVGVEAGEAVPGRTDGHGGEVNLSDGESLYGGGDGTAGPAGEWLLDQNHGSNRPSCDDEDPENSRQPFGGGDVDKTMDCGGF